MPARHGRHACLIVSCLARVVPRRVHARVGTTRTFGHLYLQLASMAARRHGHCHRPHKHTQRESPPLHRIWPPFARSGRPLARSGHPFAGSAINGVEGGALLAEKREGCHWRRRRKVPLMVERRESTTSSLDPPSAPDIAATHPSPPLLQIASEGRAKGQGKWRGGKGGRKGEEGGRWR
jgi:hypothetical protein